MLKSDKHKKVSFNKRKELKSTRGGKWLFSRNDKKKKKKGKLSGFVMLSEVLPISHEIDVKWLAN